MQHVVVCECPVCVKLPGGGVEGWGAAHLQACFSTVHHFQRLEFCLTNAVVATTALAGIGVPQWIRHASLLNARYKLREIWPGVLLFGIVLQACDATISGTVVQIRERCGCAVMSSQSTVAARGMLLCSCSRYIHRVSNAVNRSYDEVTKEMAGGTDSGQWHAKESRDCRAAQWTRPYQIGGDSQAGVRQQFARPAIVG